MKQLIIAGCLLVFGLLGVARAGAPNGFGDGSQGEDLQVPGTDQVQENEKFLDVIRGAINRVLGILGLIGLIVVMIGGFMMLTATGNSEQYASGWKYVKGALIGIMIIGVAWFVASIIFWLVNILGTDAGPANTGG